MKGEEAALAAAAAALTCDIVPTCDILHVNQSSFEQLCIVKLQHNWVHNLLVCACNS